MSWFGEGLSNITGQISNFTKEVLTEGTEEVSDHATELRIAREKISELEVQFANQRSENERLMAINSELAEKAESAELQINAISTQYRIMLEEKETEVKSLKQKQNELLELQRKMLRDNTPHTESPSVSHSSSVPHLSAAYSSASGGFHDEDFSDVIASQHEINKLSHEVQRLAAECDHWKQLASSLGALEEGKDVARDKEEIQALKTEIKELKHQLNSEVDQHQNELAALQDVHLQKLATLKKKHQTEINELQEQITELEAYTSENKDGTDPPEGSTILKQQIIQLKSQLGMLQDEHHSVREDLENVRASEKEKARKLQLLTRQMENVQKEKKTLKAENDNLAQAKQNLEHQLSEVQSECSKLKQSNDAANEQIKQRDAEMERMKKTEGMNEKMNSSPESVGANVAAIVTKNIDDSCATPGLIAGLEQENLALKDQNAVLHEQITHLEKAVQHVNKEKEQHETTIKELNVQIQQLRGTSTQKMPDQVVDSETDSTTGMDESMTSSITTSTPMSGRHRTSLAVLGDGSEIETASIASSSCHSDVSLKNRQLDEQVQTLQGQIDKYEQEIEEFEMVKSDWHIEKEALEDVLMKLRTQLRDKEMSLSLVQATKGLVEVEKHEQDVRKQGKRQKQQQERKKCKSGLMEVEKLEHRKTKDITQSAHLAQSETPNSPGMHVELDSDDGKKITSGYSSGSDTEVELEEWTQQLEMLTQANAELENERDYLAASKENLEEEVSMLKKRNEELEAMQNDTKAQDLSPLQAQIDSLQNQLVTKESEITELNQEKESLLTSLEELDEQHQQALEQVLNTRDNLVKKNDQLSLDLSNIQSKLDQSYSEIERMQVEKQESLTVKMERRKDDRSEEERIDSEINALREQLNSSSSEKSSLIMESNDLVVKLNELKEQFTQGNLDASTLKEVQEDVMVLKGQLNSSKEEIHILTTERDDLTQKLNEMRLRLSEVNRDVEVERDLLKKQPEQLASEEQTALLSERDQLLQEITDLKQRLEKGALALNNLHMDKKDLETSVASLKGELSSIKTHEKSLRDEKSELERTCGDLESQLQDAKSEIRTLMENSRETSSMNTNLENKYDKELSQLKIELTKSRENNQKYLSEIEELSRKIRTLENDIETMAMAKEDQRARLQEAEERLEDRYRRCTDDLETQIDSLKAQKESLERDLDQAEGKLYDQNKHYEKYIQEMTKAREMDTDSLRAEHEKVMKLNHEKNMQLQDLKMRCEELEADLEDTKDLLQSTIEGQKPLTELIAERETDIAVLKQDNGHLQTQLDEKVEKIQEQEAVISTMKENEKQVKTLREENVKLKVEVSTLREQQDATKMDSRTLDVITDLESEITALQSRIKGKDDEIGQLQEVIKDQETGISALNEKHAEQSRKMSEIEQSLQLHESHVSVLQQTGLNKDKDIVKLEKTLTRAKSFLSEHQLNSLDQENQPQTPNYDLPAIEFPVKEEEKVNGETEIVDLDLQDNEKTDDGAELAEEIKNLRKLIKDKDEVIEELQSNNGSLLKMLEDRSFSIHGDRTLVDLHKAQNLVKALQVEKEQMMTVMNEKTQETSSLKREVQSLMNIVSAEKAAIAKLQEDNHHLTKNKTNSEDMNDEMTKEAIKNLSRLIRDKDLEVEALKQKNETLLTVLQESSKDNKGINAVDSTQISMLMQERENLAKQVAAYQSDREQIIVALNQKHQEAVTYHGEVQRLSALLQEKEEKHERTEHDYSKLVQQFEDKQQALLKTQNDLSNYKQKYQEIDSKYQELLELQGGGHVNTVELSLYNAKCDELSQMSEKLLEQGENIKEKDGRISQMLTDVNQKEELLQSKEGEISALKKNIENLNFQMQGLTNELHDLKIEKESHQQMTTEHSSENILLKESLNNATMTVQQKEYEIGLLKEKIETLTKMLEQKGEGSNEQVQKLLKESEDIQQQAQAFQHERDQTLLALKQRQMENTELQQQVATLRQKEEKLAKELDRLRNHLLQIEDGYTQEALLAEEREKELRNRLVSAEERALSSSSAIESANMQATEQVASLQEQLHSVASQRDNAVLHCGQLNDQLQQYATSLTNLQVVLEQFQLEKASEIEKYQEEISQKTGDILQLKTENADLQNRLVEASDALEAAQRLHEQLDRKEEAICALREEVHLRETAIHESEERIRSLYTSSEGKIDKVVVKNLILGYFHTPTNQRPQVLRAIGGVLDFSKDELERVGLEASGTGSWIPSFLRRGTSGPTPPTTPRKTAFDKSFSELFVKFLEKESSPTPQLKLPVDQMVREEQEKQQHQKTVFNPFAVHANTPSQYRPDTAGIQSNQEHILMKPVFNELPMLTGAVPSLVSEGSDKGQGQHTPQGQGRQTPQGGSVTGSGRTTPQFSNLSGKSNVSDSGRNTPNQGPSTSTPAGTSGVVPILTGGLSGSGRSTPSTGNLLRDVLQ